MKKLLLFSVVVMLFATSFSPREPYFDDDCSVPVFMKREDLEKSVRYETSGRALKYPGKIYYKDHYIYVNELYKGVHVINNSDPRNPVNEGFITVPGCLDMAIKENTLLVDNSVDLVAFDLGALIETSRVRNVLPEPVAPSRYHCGPSIHNRPEGYILVAWEPKEN